MQVISSNLKAALLDIDARSTPRVLVDCIELYESDYVPGSSGFVPADAIETFAAEELTWNAVAYRREMVSRGAIVRSMGEKTNSVTLSFSNISRYMATLAQSQTIEGLFCVIRCVCPSVTDDSLVLFVGRCEKPSDIDKQSFSLSARQDFGNINQSLPPRKFTAEDPEGRLPSDDEFEGIPFIAVAGSYNFPEVVPKTGIAGLLGRRKTISSTLQWSSLDRTPYGQVVPEVFGRAQMPLIPFAWADKGVTVTYLMAACGGPIQAMSDIKSRTEGVSDPLNLPGPVGAIIHLGDLGGTGTNLGNTYQTDLGGGGKFSHLAYIEGASVPTEFFQNPSFSDPNVLNEPPEVTAMIMGRSVDLPDSSGVYNQEGWTDNPVHIARFILTNPSFVNIDPAFMEDAVNYRTALHCDQPLMDETTSQVIVIENTDINQAGEAFTRYRSTGLYTPRFFLYNHLGGVIIPEQIDGPYLPYDPLDPIDDPPLICPIGQHHDPDTGLCVPDVTGTALNASQPLLQKRYTVNFPITEEIRAVDLLNKVVFPAAKLFMRVNKRGKYEILSEQPSDATRIRSATAVNAITIPVLDVTPWKSGPNLLQGWMHLGFGLTTSENRVISSADYSTSGNSVTLTAAVTGGVTATASGATLTLGSTTVQASGTVTIGGVPGAGDAVTITIDGIGVAYIVSAVDTTGTVAAMLTAYINASPRLNKHILAVWSDATPTVITIRCLHGALNFSSALLKVHAGPVVDPVTAPTIAAAAAGALAAGDYLVAYADGNSNGLTALTRIATVTLTVGQKINVSGLPALPAGITSRQFFISEKAGSSNLRYHATRADAADFSINALPLNGAAMPPAFNSTAEEMIRIAMPFATNSQDVFPAWAPSTLIVLNEVRLPTVLNGHKYEATSITTGITAATEPTFPTSAGGTVVDGGVTWTEIGSTVLQQTGLTRANVKKNTFKWPLGSVQSSVNRVKGSYRSAKDDFALVPYRVGDPIHYAQVGKWFDMEFDGSAIDNFPQFFRIANWLLSKNREGDWFNSLETGPQGLVLEEGDCICGSDDSGGLINVVTRIEELRIAPNHDVAITKARRYSTGMFSDDVGSHSIAIASNLRFIETANSLIEFIDTPGVREADRLTPQPGFYVSVSRDLLIAGDWRGAALYADYGDGYVRVAEIDVAATMGACTDTLATVADTSVLDATGDLTFLLDYANEPITFASCTEADLVANPRRNLFLVGDEYIQAATIVDNGSRSFTISDLFHARFDSECAAHSIGERVIFIDGAEVFVPTDVSRIGIAYNYKAVTTNQDVADATPVSFTWTGNIFKLPKPSSFDGYFDGGGGDVLMDWVGTEADAGTEQYELQIRNSGDTLTLGEPKFIDPIKNRHLQEYVIWDPASVAGGGTATLSADGGVAFSSTATSIQSSVSAEVVGGLLVEWQIPIFLPGSHVSIFPEDSTGLNDSDAFAWVLDSGTSYPNYTYQPEGHFTDSPGPNISITAGDRLGIYVRPDGAVEFHLNYTPTSKPIWISAKSVQTTKRYFAYVRGGSIEKASWLRQGPEFKYVAAQQALDNGLTLPSLPSVIYARVRQLSPFSFGPPSGWTYGTFTR